MNEKERKWSLERELDLYRELGLSVMFVPLCAPQPPLKRNPTCPACGLVLIGDGEGFVCLECG
jgi:hypothetical protein